MIRNLKEKLGITVVEQKAIGGLLRDVLTINVPLFKKLRDIIFFWWEYHFMSHFEGHFVGAESFLTP
jgi:hypothetical protein